MATTAPLTLVQQSPSEKRRQALASGMMGASMQYRPMRTGWEALGNLAMAYAGKKMGQEADTSYQGRQDAATKNFADSLDVYQAATANDNPDPYMEMAKQLGVNQDTANMGAQMELNKVLNQQSALTSVPNYIKIMGPHGQPMWADKRNPTVGIAPATGTEGLKVGFNPDGGIDSLSFGGSYSPGPAGGVTGATTASVNQVQKKTFNTGESMSRMKHVRSLFKPEYQQIGKRWSMNWSSLKDKAGMLDPKDKTELAEFTTYKKQATNHLNMLFNEISGAAVSPDEAVRLKSGLPNPGVGIFDGDSPTEFKAAIDSFIGESERAIMRYNLWMKMGDKSLNPWDMASLDDTSKLLQMRQQYAETVEQELAPQFQDKALLINAVRDRLKSEGILF